MILPIRFLVLWGVLMVVSPFGAEARAALVAHWPLAGDCNDHSGRGNHGRNQGVAFDVLGPDGRTSAARFDGLGHSIEVPHTDSLSLGTGAFTLAAWVKPEDTVNGPFGDILSKYDSRLRAGVNLSLISSSSGYSSVSDSRQVLFGIDDAREGTWIDCGRPWPSNTFTTALVVYKGALYTGIADAADPNEACRVFRYDGGKGWVDCGRIGDDLKTPSVYSMTVHQGKLYAGSGVLDWEKAHRGECGPTHVYRYDGGTKWHDCGGFGRGRRVLSLASFRGRLHATDDQSDVYRYDADSVWSHCGNLKELSSKVYSTHVYRNQLYGGMNTVIVRLDGDNVWRAVGRFEESEINQVHTLSVYRGSLYAGTWPKGWIMRYESDGDWRKAGFVGIGTDRVRVNEVNDMIVYNGKFYAGVIPKSQLWRYEEDQTWTLVRQLVRNPRWAGPDGVSWNRIPCTTIFRGRLWAGTSTCHGRADAEDKTNAGKVFSWEAGRCVSFDDDLGAGWSHIAAVRESNRLILYVNGRRVTTSETFESMDYDVSNDRPLRIGFGQEDYLRGSLSDVRIYNTVLDEAAIRELSRIR